MILTVYLSPLCLSSSDTRGIFYNFVMSIRIVKETGRLREEGERER